VQRRKPSNASAITCPSVDRLTAPLLLVEVPVPETPVETFVPEPEEAAAGRVWVTTEEVGEIEMVAVPS